MFLHYMIYKNVLAVSILPDKLTAILNMVVSVINKIKMSALYTRQLITFCEDQGPNCIRLLHYTKVRWLPCGQMTHKLHTIRDTILNFLEEHKKFELSRFFYTNNFCQIIVYSSNNFQGLIMSILYYKVMTICRNFWLHVREKKKSPPVQVLCPAQFFLSALIFFYFNEYYLKK